MRKSHLYFLLVFAIIFFQSNDTVINSTGSGIFPIKESDIKMQKEILKLSLRESMYVDVYFEFFNPGKKKELTVGFVIEPKYAPDYLDNDSIDIEKRIPKINDFLVNVNGENVSYEFGLLKDTPYKEIIESEGKWNYVFYFPVVFNEGINIVKHSYNFNGGYDSSGGLIYPYVLKTAKNWAGGQIDDFTLIIEMGKNMEFNIAQAIVRNPNWEIIGEGKRDGNSFFIRDGSLQLKAKDFVPLNDLGIYVPPSINYSDTESISYQAEIASISELEKLTKERLRILRNYFFAKAGYKFNSKDLNKYYSNFLWYIPNDNLSSNQIYESLNIKTQERINTIRNLEMK